MEDTRPKEVNQKVKKTERLNSFMTEVPIILLFLYDEDLRHERVKVFSSNIFKPTVKCFNNFSEFHFRATSSGLFLKYEIS